MKKVTRGVYSKFAILLPFLAALTFAVKLSVEKSVIANVDSIYTLTLLIAIVPMSLALVILTTQRLKRQSDATKTPWRERFYMLLNGLIASGLFYYLIYTGLQDSSVMFSALSQGIMLVVTVLVGVVFMKEHFRREFWLLIALLVAGTYIVSVGKFNIMLPRRGDLYVIASAVILGLTNHFAGWIGKRNSILEMIFYNYLGAMLVMAGLLLTLQTFSTAGIRWEAVVFIGLANFIIVSLLFRSFVKVGASLTSAIMMLSPVFAAGIAYFYAGERLSFLQLVAMLVVTASGVMIALGQGQSEGNRSK